MKNQNMLNDNRIGLLLLKLTIPAFLGLAVTTLYNIVDTIFIGRFVGTIGIAGLSIVFPVQMLSIAMGQLTGMGGASMISRLIGAKKIPRAEHALGNAIFATVAFSIIVMIAGLSNTDFWIRLLGASDTILPFARDYITIILYGVLFQTLAMSLSMLIRAEGNIRVPMIGMIMSAVLNIILDAILIIPLGMGIKGAALATVISQLINVLYYCAYFMSGKNYLKIALKNLIVEWAVLGEILSIGIASFTMLIAVSISTVVINRVLIIYGGDFAVSTYGIVNRLMMFAIMPGIVIGQGLQPILGFNYGASRYEPALKAIRLAIVSATAFCIGIFLCLYFIPEPFVRIFTNDKELIDMSSFAAKRVFFVVYLTGFIMVGSTIFQSIGKPVQSFITSIAKSIIILIPSILILPRFFQLEGVWLAFPVTDALSFLLTLILLIPLIKNFQRGDPVRNKIADVS